MSWRSGLCLIALAVFDLCACGGNSRREIARDGAGGSGGSPTQDAGLALPLVVAGEFQLVGAKNDGSRLAYLDTENGLFVVTPGEAPERVPGTFDRTLAVFARDADVLVAETIDRAIVRYTPDEGGVVIGAGAFEAVSYDGRAIAYEDASRQMMIWYPPAEPLALGTPDSMAVAADGHLIVLVAGALISFDQATRTTRTLADGVWRFGVSGDGRTLVFERSTDPAGIIEVRDILSNEIYATEVGTVLIWNDDRSGFLFSRDGEIFLSSLRYTSMSFGPLPEGFSRALAVSPGLELLAYQKTGGDYEVPLGVTAEGGAAIFGTWTYGNSPLHFRGPSSLLVFAGKPCACGAGGPYEVRVGDMAAGATRTISDYDVDSFEPVLDDSDLTLLRIGGFATEPMPAELRVVSAASGTTREIKSGVGHYLQVSERRIAVDTHAEEPGIYLLPIPNP